MTAIVGSIAPAVDHKITESPGFTEPTRVLPIYDGVGRKHGSIQWVASEVDREFMDVLSELCRTAMRVNRRPQSPAS